jgi:hypothetical protein
MQKVLIGFLAVTTAVLSVVCGVQWQQLQAARERARVETQARAVEAEAREAQTARLNELERNEARLEKQVQQFSKLTTTLRANETTQSTTINKMAERIRAANANGAASADAEGGAFGKGMGDMIGKMMKDPAMREMMREQQKAAIGMMYSGLFKDLNLSPDEKEKLKALLTDSQMRALEGSQALFGNDDKAAAAEAEKQVAETKKQTDAEIKALLGDERFAQYQDYQKNMGERMQLDQFKSRLTGDNLAMRDDQAVQMLQIMKEEKAAVPPVLPTDQTQFPKKDTLTSENIEKQIQWMQDYNQRVLARAGNVLTPEQFKQYQTFLQEQESMQRLGMTMARQMFRSGKGADTK